MSETIELDRSEIQLVELKLISVGFVLQSKVPADATAMEKVYENLKVTGGVNEINDDDRTIEVVITVHAGLDNSEAPFRLEYSIGGIFKYSGDSYERSRLDDWARKNAVYILTPYIREGMYTSTLLSPHGPFILPMFNVPIPS